MALKRGRRRGNNYTKITLKTTKTLSKEKKEKVEKEKTTKKQQNLSSWQRPRWLSAKKDPGVGVGLEKVKFLIWISCVFSHSEIECYKELSKRKIFVSEGR